VPRNSAAAEIIQDATFRTGASISGPLVSRGRHAGSGRRAFARSRLSACYRSCQCFPCSAMKGRFVVAIVFELAECDPASGEQFAFQFG
jgi:hypothetical protein